MSSHTLSVLVEDTPGILARASSLFSRRGFNIDSLSVSTTEYPGLSRMTIVVNCDLHPLEQVTKQLNKLVNVVKIVEMDTTASVRRELLL
ncbi:acetolactate synthase small subunit, partial [Nocardiopsis tropica]|nr:acetolactate synthase small subunit [Nocardiopsis tropica]